MLMRFPRATPWTQSDNKLPPESVLYNTIDVSIVPSLWERVTFTVDQLIAKGSIASTDNPERKMPQVVIGDDLRLVLCDSPSPTTRGNAMSIFGRHIWLQCSKNVRLFSSPLECIVKKQTSK